MQIIPQIIEIDDKMIVNHAAAETVPGRLPG